MNTQNAEILNHLKKGNSITGLEAVMDFGCICLPRRIKDLRDGLHDGYKWPIQSKWVNNGKKRYMEYSLTTNSEQLQLYRRDVDMREAIDIEVL